MTSQDVPEEVALPRDTTTYSRLRDRRWLFATRALWGVIAILSVFLFIAAVPVRHEQLLAQAEEGSPFLTELSLSERFFASYSLVLSVIGVLTFFVVALLLFWRRSDDWMATLVSIMLFTFGGVTINNTVSALVDANSDWQFLAFTLSGIGQGTFIFFLYVFPDGRFIPRWAGILAVGLGVWAFITNVFPDLPVIAPSAWPDWLGMLVYLGIYTGAVPVQNYRRAKFLSPAQRQQTKWVFLGLYMALLGFIVLFVVPSIFPVLAEPGTSKVVYDLFSLLFTTVAFAFVPIAIGFSALHYRLWDADLAIHRGLAYSALTVVLGLVFLGSAFLLQRGFHWLTGGEQSPIALAASALVIGALFQPTRRRLQRLIDRRFYGIQVDFRQVGKPPRALHSPSGALSGTSLDSYTVLESLGRGGMAEVYKGWHPTLNRAVAIKVMDQNLAAEGDFRMRFEREAQTVAALRHPNIVQVFDFGEVDRMHFMVMEHIDGPSLADTLQQSGPMPLGTVQPLAQDIASALDYAHEQGIVHRDVKPSNVMLQPVTTEAPGSPEHRAVLMDFGIAKIISSGTRLTKTGMMGTLDYMAPEQIAAAREVDHHADIYAMGVMVYQMLTGELPFAGDNPGTVVFGHLQQPAPDPRLTIPTLPEPVALAVLRALEKDPAARYQTAAAFADALR